jgi:dihydrofolate synthase/folylpolyglutamate synthase
MKQTELTGRINPVRDGIYRFSTLQEWLDWQEKLHFTAIELGLDRCRKVAELMKLLPASCFVISVAGTNGKGSTSVMLAEILQSAGYRVGLYTSPHLIRYNERIKINGVAVTDDLLCTAFSRIDRARGNISLTYFEFGTLAAMDIFRSEAVDIAVMEVGMGGRLDAVNMLDANVSVVTTIDIDHVQWLGPDRESIGREKAGIFRPMRPAICADPSPPATVTETASLIGANLLRAGVDYQYESTKDGWAWRSGMTRFNRLPLPGGHLYQIQNAAGVLMVLQAIADYYPVPQQILCESLRNFRMPGRFQIVPGEVPFILDVAHNRQSLAMLASNISKLPSTGRINLVLGMLADKDHAACVGELLPYVDRWYLATLAGPRGVSASELATIIRTCGTNAEIGEFTDVTAAITAARSSATDGDRIIVTGSFVTVGLASTYLGLEV